MADQAQADRERADKERRAAADRQNQQADAEFEKIKVTIEKVKVDVPSNVRGKLDEVLQAVQSLVTHYKQQAEASQLPAGQQPGQPVQPIAPGGQPQPK